MKNFTKQNIEEIAYYIWEEDKQKSPEVCWQEALGTIDWDLLLIHHIVSEDFVKEFFFKKELYNYDLDGVPTANDWLITEQRWSVEFIEKLIENYFINKKTSRAIVALEQIFGNQKLPEWFLIKYADCFKPKWNSFWPKIIPNHQLSEDLLNKIVENEPNLFESICYFQHLTTQFIEKHKKQFTSHLWNIIFTNQPKTKYLFNLYKEIHNTNANWRRNLIKTAAATSLLLTTPALKAQNIQTKIHETRLDRYENHTQIYEQFQHVHELVNNIANLTYPQLNLNDLIINNLKNKKHVEKLIVLGDTFLNLKKSPETPWYLKWHESYYDPRFIHICHTPEYLYFDVLSLENYNKDNMIHIKLPSFYSLRNDETPKSSLYGCSLVPGLLFETLPNDKFDKFYINMSGKVADVINSSIGKI